MKKCKWCGEEIKGIDPGEECAFCWEMMRRIWEKPVVATKMLLERLEEAMGTWLKEKRF